MLLFCNPWKHQKNQIIFNVFMGYRLAWNGSPKLDGSNKLFWNFYPRSCSQFSYKNVFLQILQNPQGHTLCSILLFWKSCRLLGCNFMKKRLRHSCFSVNVSEKVQNSFFTEHPWITVSRAGFSERFSGRNRKTKKKRTVTEVANWKWLRCICTKTEIL